MIKISGSKLERPYDRRANEQRVVIVEPAAALARSLRSVTAIGAASWLLFGSLLSLLVLVKTAPSSTLRFNSISCLLPLFSTPFSRLHLVRFNLCVAPISRHRTGKSGSSLKLHNPFERLPPFSQPQLGAQFSMATRRVVRGAD